MQVIIVLRVHEHKSLAMPKRQYFVGSTCSSYSSLALRIFLARFHNVLSVLGVETMLQISHLGLRTPQLLILSTLTSGGSQ